jgi:DNA polymerase-3 subunit gamma/tau
MAYQAMARRYRPSAFDEVVGQEHVAQTLKNAITSNRVAHAYLFCGPHGVGKTSMARIFAKALNCTGGPSTDIPEDCPICADINAGRDPDVQEIDGASNNSVDQVRTLREQAGYVPARARFKIYIIDEVHMLSGSAFNALLKTLEEPPPHVKFILATTEPHKLLETVLSRCQRFDFRLVPAPRMAEYLGELCTKENVAADEDALSAIAAFASGSMRDGLVLLDQLVSYCPDGVKREDVERVRGVAGVESIIGIYDAIVKKDSASAFSIVEEVAARGTSVGDFLDQLIDYGRDLMLYITTKSVDNISSYGPARESVCSQSENINLEEVLLALDVFTSARIKVRSRALSNPLVPLEMAIARLSGLSGVDSVGNVIGRIEELAKSGALSGGADVNSVRQAGAPAPSAQKKTAEISNTPVEPAAENSNSNTSSANSVSNEESASAQAPWEGRDEFTATEKETQTGNAHSSPMQQSYSSSQQDERQDASNSNKPKVEGGDSTPAGTFSGVNLSISFVEERWSDVLSKVAENYKPDMAYMSETLPVAIDPDGTLVIELPMGGVFLLERIEEGKRRDRLAEALEQVLGRSVKFRLVISETRKSAVGEGIINSGKPKNAALNDPTVKKFVERFKCEIMNIE